jgi:hypothetical protein
VVGVVVVVAVVVVVVVRVMVMVVAVVSRATRPISNATYVMYYLM